ncbi:phosphoglucosamine mutase [Thauera mechernichensis]|uniref:Phosphoglucosamine mutase n=1 Tax=Thauera mechernichensis TaxID=82788 RepID=A0ABW3WE95_9RHOO|nr:MULTISPECIES: phosphoglucosamine mutase [Thauera]ENO76344.1 phosphoglucosamine mutase [Thauera sp. 27]ENO92871.1 phosphoglucosamine mutase [Thauera sp. 28]MDG3064048.1 phosphoglucosamine mutase [Thauera mechernichensis]WBL65885.1 phosphoglucosamine mutase [Thauera sp. WB-2]HAG76046.1 phosphoglucosamine mutase [Thauera sp.]
MGRKYFGTDGVRGRVGEEPITPEFVMRLGYAAGVTLVAREKLPAGEHPAVLIGKDTRVSGYMLEAALEAGFAAAGVNVMLAGPIPTPAVAYLTRALRLQAGVVISASHNPFYDNGIKFFSAGGTKLPDAVEAEIEAHLDEPMGCVDSAQLGRARRVEDAAGRYIEFCKSTFPNELDLRGLRIAVDCAHGAAYHIAPKVLHELGAEVLPVGVEPNGLNINDGVGATRPENLRSAVLAQGADLGIALDGDADRLMMVDARGEIYDGDKLLYVIARARHAEDRLDGVVGTLMSNLGFEHAIGRLGAPFARAKVGDRYVLELLHERGWKLGGENSGHIICLDRHTTGDGMVSALQVLAALKQRGETLADACADLVFYPQRLINVRMAAGFDWQADATIARARDDAERELGESGRVLLRPSGTEPLLRVMVEGCDGAQVDRLAKSIASAVEHAIG